ncbi:family 20 glycosylhydrolase [Pedobacter sp. KR3-3]|uniref:Family 20 glycosylhydrolase n=1 Tax=Pedobacter albus TaxID=3113905 RepID=A0ABU7I202_9SPHI|nr:family 20 glycosylhydrolase [Pedobacter sp. KR3-3]MEE1943467.1 family 20 glycosylhydrolase [Pedobacter sp. KR3-3]
MSILKSSKLAFLAMGMAISAYSYAQTATNPAPHVIPALRAWKGASGQFRLKKQVNIAIQPGAKAALMPYIQTFLNDLSIALPGHRFVIKDSHPANGDIYFSLKADSSIKKEGYILKIGDRIDIEALEPKGAFWATRTLLQLLEQDPRHENIAKGEARDYPQFAVRGFVLDVGRKFFSLKFLRDYVKLMSYYKLNDFQIHLNDNGFKQFFNNDWDKTYSAFRLENETYPNLTAKDGSYSKKEFIELQQLATAYGVKIIPEIDVPAHSLSFVKAVPEIGSKKYGMDHLDINNPKTKEVINNVFKEYLSGPNPVFIGDEVHIGTDEYAKAEAEKFREFTDDYIKYVESFGKKVRLWGALTHAKGNTRVKVKDVTMNVWYNGYADPKEMIDLGYDVISTPDGWLYIVPKAGYYYDYLNLKKIYNEWTPNIIGNQTFEENHPKIKGGSFAVWNDHVGNGITEKDVHDRAFPAVQVLAQKMWDGTAAKSLLSYDEFAKQSKRLGEGPGLNMRGQIIGKDSLVLHYSFDNKKTTDISADKRKGTISHLVQFNKAKGRKSAYFKDGEAYIQTPLTGIGYNYTVSFWINPEEANADDAVLFSSADATVKLKQQQTGKLGFSRENYHYNFNYSVPANTWTHLVITGNNKGTSLYVNGKLQERLEGAMQEFPNTKDKIAKVQTLFFPLEYIGAPKNSFKGQLDEVKVFNKILSDEAIKNLK